MLVINGSFLCRNLTGIERFAMELCKQLDSICNPDDFTLYVPKNARIVPNLKTIKIVISNKECNSFPKWDHLIMASYCRKVRSYSIDFANITSLFRPGFVFIHDIYAKLYPEDFSSIKDKLRQFYMCMMYKHACKHGRCIFTVSNFSKNQITNTYKVSENKIKVIPNGWDHFNFITPDSNIFEKHPELKEQEFYFTLGSLQKRKNLRWIAEYAANHTDEVFAISGKAISGMVSDDLKVLQTLPNVILLGYVSDEEVKALMSSCKAFIFPSYYEGFGIPPLEALSVGAKIVISNSACLPEIYKDCAYYIEADNNNVNLSEILDTSVAAPDQVLNYYTYKNAAKIFYEEIQKCI